MNPKPARNFINPERIAELCQLEPLLVILGLAASAFLFYKIFLRRISSERHRSFLRQFKEIFIHGLIATGLYLGHEATAFGQAVGLLQRFSVYFGFFALIWYSITFVKTIRVIFFEYLVAGHMRVGVPLLLLDILSLLVSLGILAWFLAEIFEIKLGPLMATSAIISVVLGLALQETLGNLFAGIALQFDKPYEIGDWIEFANGNLKWTGQVKEISWRSTILVGFMDELITIPNRTIGQSEISNFSAKMHPICRAVTFRLPHDAPVPQIKEAMIKLCKQNPYILKAPEPLAIVNEVTESWLNLRVVYFINDFGKQYLIADAVYTVGMNTLKGMGLELAKNRIEVTQSPN